MTPIRPSVVLAVSGYAPASSVAWSLVVVVASVAAWAGVGSLVLRPVPVLRREPVVVLGVGLVAWAAAVLLGGHLPLLRPVPVAVWLLLGVVLAGVEAAQLGSLVRRVADAARRAWGDDRWIVGIVAVAAAVLVVAAMRLPFAQDELDYHWAGPLAWAHAGAWVDTPFRFTDGPALMEIAYSVPAVWKLSTAAHLYHLVTFGLLVVGAAQLAVRRGGAPALAAGVAVAVPAALVQAAIAYNDVAAAALLVAATVALVAGAANRAARPDIAADRASDLGAVRAWLVGGVLVAGAISVKPLVGVFVPVAVWAACWCRGVSVRSLLRSWRDALVRGGALVLPVVVAGLAWVAHSWLLTRRLLPASDGVVVARTAENPLLTLRIPVVRDVLRAPFDPVLTSVLGQREPYGGRSSLFVAVALLVAVVAWRRTPLARRRAARPFAVPGLAALIVLGIVVTRTRFELYPYALLGAGLVAFLGSPLELLGRPRRWLPWVVRLTVLVPVLDAGRKLW